MLIHVRRNASTFKKNMIAAAPKLKVRNVQFIFDKVQKHWILGSTIATHFVNSMHIVFPEGEKFFVRSVRKFSKEIKDKTYA